MSFLGSLFGSPKTQNSQAAAVSGLQFQSSVYGKAIAKGFGTNRTAPNLLWYGDFASHAQQSSGGGGGGKGGVGGGGGGKGGGGSTGYTYSTSVIWGLGCGPITGIGRVFRDKNIYASLADAGPFVFLDGGYAQDPWSYLTSAHPTEALNYRGTGYVAAPNIDLGNSPQLSNFNFEVQWGSLFNATDADPSVIIGDILTNTHDGIGFPSSWLATLTNYQNYVLASNLLMSPLFDTQSTAAQIIDTMSKITNSEPIWTGGQLQIVPYGDTDITGNGHTYTAPAAPVIDLDVANGDFIFNSSGTGSAGNSTSDPIIISRPDQTKNINSIVLEYLDRTNNYNPSTVQYKNDASILDFGLNKENSSRDGHMFCDGDAAKASVTLQGQREIAKNMYQFTTDGRYIWLDPMDIITITNPNQSLSRQWVRVKEMTEDADLDQILFVCEEYLTGNGHAATYSFATGSGYNVDYNSDPGNVNTPIIFEPPVQIAVDGLDVFAAVSGGDNWGGCDVWISTDGGSSYPKTAGRINGSARMGVLSHSLASGSDPDQSNVLQVDLTQSDGELLSGTQDDADNFHTLCYVDGELISYQTATLTATNKYNLSYLRRGIYGTTNEAHANASAFARLDQGIFAYAYDKTQIGQTIYLKFVSFNIWGGGQQDIATVTAYPYTIVGPPDPPNVTGFGGQQNGNAVVFNWTQVDDFALKGYDIGFAPLGETDWDNFEMLTEAAKGTEMTNASVQPGSWTFAIRARDVADQLSPLMATFDLEVTNQNQTLTVQEQDPDYPGTVSNFVRHWTGKLIPENLYPPNHYASTTAAFSVLVPDPVASCYYITPTYDIGYVANSRLFESNAFVLAGGNSGTPAGVTYLDAWQTGPDPGVYVPWTIGSLSFRYANMKITYAPVAGAVGLLDEFAFTIDQQPIVESSAQTTVIAPGGTAITFDPAYHVAPFVVATVLGGTALYATVASVTTTGATIHVWSSAGADVGGTVTWTATGT